MYYVVVTLVSLWMQLCSGKVQVGAFNGNSQRNCRIWMDRVKRDKTGQKYEVLSVFYVFTALHPLTTALLDETCAAKNGLRVLHTNGRHSKPEIAVMRQAIV